LLIIYKMKSKNIAVLLLTSSNAISIKKFSEINSG
jgi:hypothetical protein